MNMRRLFILFAVIFMCAGIACAEEENKFFYPYTYDDYKGDMWYVLRKEPCLREIEEQQDIDRAELIYLLYKLHFWRYNLFDFCEQINGEIRAKSLDDIWSMTDEHTSRATVSDMIDSYIKSRKGRLGINLINDKANGRIVVSHMINNSPAYRAGIRLGDYIVDIDNISVGNNCFETASRIVGDVGTPVVLTIERDGKRITKKIIRKQIVALDVNADIFGDIGYIALSSFSLTGEEKKLLYDIVKNFGESDIKGFILDLRSNYGGSINIAIELLCMLIPDKVLFLESSAYAPKLMPRTCAAYSDMAHVRKNLAMIVMVDSQTYSASEIVAGSLQYYNRVLLAGSRTGGKGVWTAGVELHDNSMLKITQGAWFLPDGTWINYRGIEPDISLDKPVGVFTDILDMKMDLYYKHDIELLKALSIMRVYVGQIGE